MKNFFKVARVGLMVMVCALFLVVGIKAEAAPSKVAGLKQVADDSGAVGIQWTVPSGSPAKYSVEWSKDSKFVNTATYGSKEETQYQNGTVITGLDAGSSYYVKVTAIDASGESGESSNVFEVVTAPSGKLTGLKQTKAGTKSLTLSWKKVTGANVYDIAYYKKSTQNSSNAKYYTTKTDTASQSLTLAANTKYRVDVAPARKSSSGYVAYGANTSGWMDASTMPKKITKVKFLMGGSSTQLGDASSNSQAKQAYFSWARSDAAQGYEYTVYGNNGKKLFTGTTTTDTPNKGVKISSKKLTNTQFMKIKVRAFIKVNGKKKYAAASDDCWFAKYPSGVKRAMVGNTAADGVKISWKKMTGAKNYTVYISTSPNTGYKKAGTTSKTSYVIKKCNGAALTSGRTYYYYVVASKKVGKKTVKSDDTWFGQFHITTYYY